MCTPLSVYKLLNQYMCSLAFLERAGSFELRICNEVRRSPQKVVLLSPTLFPIQIPIALISYFQLQALTWCQVLNASLPLWGFGCRGSGLQEQSWWLWGDLLQRNLRGDTSGEWSGRGVSCPDGHVASIASGEGTR